MSLLIMAAARFLGAFFFVSSGGCQISAPSESDIIIHGFRDNYTKRPCIVACALSTCVIVSKIMIQTANLCSTARRMYLSDATGMNTNSPHQISNL